MSYLNLMGNKLKPKEVNDTLEEGGGSDLPDVSEADNGKVLGVVNGAWSKADPPSGGLDYSTTEQNTGKKWVDNKDIYQLSFSQYLDADVSNGYFVGALPQDLDIIIGIDGFVTTENKSNGYTLNGIAAMDHFSFALRKVGNKLILFPGDGYFATMSEVYHGTCNVTILYTKATATRTKKRTTK